MSDAENALTQEALARAAEALADAARASGPATEYLNTEQAARYLGLSKVRLEMWRCRGGGPPYVRIGTRIIRYRRSQLDAWMAEHQAEHAPAAPRG